MSEGTLREYCACGAGMEATVDPRIVEELRAIFWRVHAGEGHKPCDRPTAMRARTAAGD